MKVEIAQRETIKPCSPTAPSKRDYKLSLIDQLSPGPYVPIILFYDSNTKLSLDHLKKSLSKTLTYMYPLAGRIKDDFTIECNDEGVDFLEANVSNITLSNIVNDPKIENLCQLLPYQPHDRSKEPSEQVLLAIQLSKFPCGGISICVCVWHLIADASTLGTFVKTWAKVNQENDQEMINNGFIVDVTGIFPPREIGNNPLLTMIPTQEELPFKISMKRFIFDNSKLATLIQSFPVEERYTTRVEALSAFLWSSIISTWKDKKSEIKVNILMSSINLRKRMSPNFPTNCIGNLIYPTMAKWEVEEEEGEMDYKKLVEKVQESIWKVDDGYIRRIHEKNEYIDYLKSILELCTTRGNEVGIVGCISWCKLGFYEGDFGWGKPIWIANPVKSPCGFHFMDSADGKGIEVWMGLPQESMKLLEKNEDFLSYVSLSQDI